MADAPWTTLLNDAHRFLSDLSHNNTRDWFTAHKDNYEARLKAPALALMDVVSADLQRLTGAPVTSKLWRPHRDVRFSKDKTPYHIHLHMGWTANTGGRQPLGWFFGIAPDYISAGAGIVAFDKPVLEDWRKTVGGAQGAAIARDIQAARALGYRLDDPDLKRVPSPFDRDHPQGELLRRKGLTLWRDWNKNDPSDVQDRLHNVFTELRPIQTRLQAIL